MWGPMHWGQNAPTDWMGWSLGFGPVVMVVFWIVLVAAIVWLAVEVRRLRIATSNRA